MQGWLPGMGAGALPDLIVHSLNLCDLCDSLVNFHKKKNRGHERTVKINGQCMLINLETALPSSSDTWPTPGA
jgi:hypothetical protein